MFVNAPLYSDGAGEFSNDPRTKGLQTWPIAYLEVRNVHTKCVCVLMHGEESFWPIYGSMSSYYAEGIHWPFQRRSVILIDMHAH